MKKKNTNISVSDPANNSEWENFLTISEGH